MFRNLLRFFLHRNKDKAAIKSTIKNTASASKELDESDAYSLEVLNAMQAVIRMKEAADREGVGFAAGFVTPNGKRFLVSNVGGENQGTKYVNYWLDKTEQRIKKSNKEAS
jgi:hypothetical protein